MTRGEGHPPPIAAENDVPYRLGFAHAFGVYPVALKDAVISLGDDAFLFCVGRQIATFDHVTQRLSFLTRDSKNRTVTAATRSANSRLLAVAERVSADNAEGSAQISILNLPKTDAVDASPGGAKGEAKEEALKVLHPQNRKLDIVGLVFASADGRFLVSLSAMPDCTITYWKWEVDKVMALHDCKPNLPLTRLQVNPANANQLSISGPKYMKIWEYNANDGNLKECVSMYPGANQEKQMDIVDHCWALRTILCAITTDGMVHLFEDGEFKDEVNVRKIIEKDDSTGEKAKEKQQAQALQSMVAGRVIDDTAPIRLNAIAPWGRGFVVGGDQGYLGVFKLDANLKCEPFGTFRMPGEDSTIWHMSASSEDTHLTILSYQEQDAPAPSGGPAGMPRTMRTPSAQPSAGGRPRATTGSMNGTTGGSMSSTQQPPATKEKLWSLSTFPVGQADLANTGHIEVFRPVFELGTHHGPVLGMAPGGNRQFVATIGSDSQLKLWGYPSEEGRTDGTTVFSSELSIHVSQYETPKAIAVHPLGFQAAVILDDSVRIYHLGTQQITRTLYELPLKRPGDVAFSANGSMLAVTSEKDVILIDPWRSTLVHVFGGRGGHLSMVNQVLFSEDDRMLLSCGVAPTGAIYGWNLESEEKTREFEHVSKSATFISLAYDFRRQLAVTCVKEEGCIRVIGHPNPREPDLAISEPFDIPADSRSNGYSALRLAGHLGLLFAGMQQGFVRVFNWPLKEGGVAANPCMEFSIHAHSITALVLTQDSRFLFSSCAGGAVFANKIEAVDSAGSTGTSQLLQRYVRYRYQTDGSGSGGRGGKSNKDEERKLLDLQKKLTQAGHHASTATLDELVMVPKVYYQERLQEIKELEERMLSLRHESEYALEEKEKETAEKMNAIQQERKKEKQKAGEKYDALFAQLKKANERHQSSMSGANENFDRRTRELQNEFEQNISKEYATQTRLLDELNRLGDEHEDNVRAIEEKHDAQLSELRTMQEKATREWRTQYDMVCNLLKSDGLKFEEALKQQESEYESQITEILEHKRVALQVESERSMTALKDGVSMRQTISMLHRQLKAKDTELAQAKTEKEDLQKQLEATQKMFENVEINVKELKRGLKVKDDSLSKLREQMKHLESFRFVLFHKVRALEEERDPLDAQVNSLKTSTREMYNEFVREFRQKQKLDQQLTDNITKAKSLQDENVEMRATLVQLKKDARRMIQEVEQILHAETTSEFEKMPKKLMEVLEKHKKLNQWAPPAEDEGGGRTDQDLAQESALIQEMAVQRDLLFRKNQIAVSQASQAKRECTQDFRRLTSENAALIAEMNTLRSENRSYQRSYKELEAQLLELRQAKGGRGGGMGAVGTLVQGGGMGRNASAPDLGGANGGPPAGLSGGGRGRGGRTTVGPGAPDAANTPYVRRKVVDQQELYRRQRQKVQNQLPPPQGSQLPPVPSSITMATRMKPSVEERRFAQTLDTVDAGRRQMERQGFDLGRLTSQAAAMSGFYDGAEFAEEVPSPTAVEAAAAAGGDAVGGNVAAAQVGSAPPAE